MTVYCAECAAEGLIPTPAEPEPRLCARHGLYACQDCGAPIEADVAPGITAGGSPVLICGACHCRKPDKPASPTSEDRVKELEGLVVAVAEALLCDGHTEQITASNIVEAAASIHRGFHREIERGCELEARLAAVKALCKQKSSGWFGLEVLRAAEGK